MLKLMRQCPTTFLTSGGVVALGGCVTLAPGVQRGRGSGPKQFDERCRYFNDFPARGRRSCHTHIKSPAKQ